MIAVNSTLDEQPPKPRGISATASAGKELSEQVRNRQETIATFLENEYSGIGSRVSGYEARHRGLIQKWFTDRNMAKLLEEQKLQEVKSFHEYRREAFTLAVDTKLEIAHEHCLRMVREAKVGDRERFSAFVMANQRELRNSVHRERESFLVDIDRQYALVERYAHREAMAVKFLDSLEKEVTQYFAWIDGLMDWFMAISQERVNQYRITE